MSRSRTDGVRSRRAVRRVHPLLAGMLIGIALVAAAAAVRFYELRIERLELHVNYIEGFLEQATRH